jgi:polyhydroxyalkanoate synthesis regulator phasin
MSVPEEVQEAAQKYVDDLNRDIQYQLATLGYVIIKDGKVLDPVSDKEAFYEAEREFLEEECKQRKKSVKNLPNKKFTKR